MTTITPLQRVDNALDKLGDLAARVAPLLSAESNELLDTAQDDLGLAARDLLAAEENLDGPHVPILVTILHEGARCSLR